MLTGTREIHREWSGNKTVWKVGSREGEDAKGMLVPGKLIASVNAADILFILSNYFQREIIYKFSINT